MPDSASLATAVPHAGWRWINWLALDAVAVAVAWQLVFARMTGARLMPLESVTLGCVVWIIYMADRLLDATTPAGIADRHRFAARNFTWLLPTMLVVVVATGWWALHHLRWVTLRTAMGVGSAIMVYFLIILAARWKAVSQVLLTGVCGLIIMGLVQGETMSAPGLQLWRAVVAGIMATVLYVGLRHQYVPPPWILTKKAMGGYLFAIGVAAAPFSHLQDWPGLLHSAPVMLFAAACTLNSLGIRLWENEDSTHPELTMLRRLYPWLLAAIAGGSATEAWVADEWSRPVLAGTAVCAAGFALLHMGRKRWAASRRALAADGIMFMVALLVLHWGMSGLP